MPEPRCLLNAGASGERFQQGAGVDLGQSAPDGDVGGEGRWAGQEAWHDGLNAVARVMRLLDELWNEHWLYTFEGAPFSNWVTRENVTATMFNLVRKIDA